MKLFDNLDNLIRTRLLEEIKVGRDLIINVGSYSNIMQFRLILVGKTDQEIPKSSRFEFLKRFLANNFPSDAEQNTAASLFNCYPSLTKNNF